MVNNKFPITWIPLTYLGKTYVGISWCPGKFSEKQGSTKKLWSDLKSLKEQKIDVIISLASTKEIESLGIAGFNENLQRFGFIHYMEAIEDFSVPAINRTKSVRDLVGIIFNLLTENKNVLIHCNAGLGRSGIIVALLIKFIGGDEDSVSYLRKFRPGAVETKEQESFVRNFNFSQDKFS